jgi:glycosyltransferase involved in cell wall biosynthesis
MNADDKKLKVALTHDFLTAYGGAERVLEVLCEMFPDAPIYTLLYDKEKMRGKFRDREIWISFLQKFPKFLRKRQKYLLPILPVAPETFDLREYDLVISSSGAWTKGVITRLNTRHIAYVHSPMRFAWDVNEEYLQQNKLGVITGFFTRKILNYVRVWDKVAADRPDYLIANSRYTQARIKKYYGRESEVIYPPVSFAIASSDTLSRNDDRGHFLVVSRLSPYKKIDVIVEAFNKLEMPLLVIGEGSEEKHLRNIAGPNVKIMGFLPDEKLPEIYSRARGFVFSGVDDFGIASVEAMSYGVPVLAIRKGGVMEIVEEGKTGEFFDAATPEVIADAVRRFLENEKKYDRVYIEKEAKKFSKEAFIEKLKHLIHE